MSKRTITSYAILAATMSASILGVVWIYAGIHYYLFATGTNQEAIDICKTIPTLDCHVDNWPLFLGLGSTSVAVAVGLMFAFLRLRRG